MFKEILSKIEYKTRGKNKGISNLDEINSELEKMFEPVKITDEVLKIAFEFAIQRKDHYLDYIISYLTHNKCPKRLQDQFRKQVKVKIKNLVRSGCSKCRYDDLLKLL